jgi:hypothetical protein
MAKTFRDKINRIFDFLAPPDVPENTEQDIEKWFDKCVEECPKWIAEKSVEYLKLFFTDQDKSDITEEWKKDHNKWWALYHHGWGTAIRNNLRDNVCRDDKLPSGNWDDYYIQFVEIALELRKFNP